VSDNVRIWDCLDDLGLDLLGNLVPAPNRPISRDKEMYNHELAGSSLAGAE
jgi:hypothetical protein